jgi:hypothetical protein
LRRTTDEGSFAVQLQVQRFRRFCMRAWVSQ